MTDKQIIIDGVNVRECACIIEDYYYQQANNLTNGYKHIKNICELGESGAECYRLFCKDNPNCYYKQLKRKEQECVELKNQVCSLRPELKSIIDKTCCKYNIEAKNYHEKIIEIIKNLDKYEQTLAEIKPILEIYANTKVGEELLNGTSQVIIEDLGVLGSIRLTFDPNPAKQTLQKINEVLND